MLRAAARRQRSRSSGFTRSSRSPASARNRRVVRAAIGRREFVKPTLGRPCNKIGQRRTSTARWTYPLAGRPGILRSVTEQRVETPRRRAHRTDASPSRTRRGDRCRWQAAAGAALHSAEMRRREATPRPLSPSDGIRFDKTLRLRRRLTGQRTWRPSHGLVDEFRSDGERRDRCEQNDIVYRCRESLYVRYVQHR